jgi:hypothetical protein
MIYEDDENGFFRGVVDHLILPSVGHPAWNRKRAYRSMGSTILLDGLAGRYG